MEEKKMDREEMHIVVLGNGPKEDLEVIEGILKKIGFVKKVEFDPLDTDTKEKND